MAKPRRFVRHETDDPELSKVQDQIEQAVDGLADHEMLQGVKVTDAALVAGETTVVRHSLGRIPNGRQVTAQDAQAQIWNTQPPTTGALYLGTSADVTVSFWVF